MTNNIKTLHIEDEPWAVAEVERVLRIFEKKSYDDVCFQNILPGPEWIAEARVEQAFKLIEEHWNRLDLVLLDIKLMSDEAKGRVDNAGVKLLLDIEKLALRKNIERLPFKVIISTAHIEYGQEVLQQSEIIRRAVVGYTMKDPVDDTLLPALERFVTAMLERDRPMLNLLQNLNPPRLIMPPRQYDGWGEKTTVVLRPDQILYVKGQQAYHHVHLTAAAQKQFEALLKQEGEAQVLRKNAEYESLRKQLKSANTECKKAEPFGGKNYRIASETVEKLKDQFSNLKLSILKKEPASPTDYFRYSGGIGEFMKMEGTSNHFQRITDGFAINVQYLAYFGSAQNNNAHTLFDDSIPTETRLINVPR